MQNMRRRQLLFPIAVALGSVFLLSCAPPVLNKQFLDRGERELSFESLRERPGEYKGRLFIFGGVIVRTKLTNAGALFEAIHLPVNGSGYFMDSGRSEGRFLALLPKDAGMPDPVIYHKGRRITVAAEFTEIRTGRIDETEYGYPLFRIKQLYLWPEERAYASSPPPYFYFDPWFYPYPYYYGHPWWFHPRRNAPAPVVRPRITTPSSRRAPAPDRTGR